MPPEFSSEGSGWSGFRFEIHLLPPRHDELGLSWQKTHLHVCLAGRASVHVTGVAGERRYLSRPGHSISLFPAGTGHTNLHRHGDRERIAVVEMDSARIRPPNDDGSNADLTASLVPQIGVDDQQAASLVRTMIAEVKAGCPGGRLYGESLSMALAAYVRGRYAATGRHTPDHELRFSGSQLRRVLDYMRAHVGSDFRLVDLAGALQISARHFTRLFRNSFGTTPHRYVLAERVKFAKILLRRRRVPIVDIAARLGFASQSHFTQVFRKETGVPPSRYRREV
jgi:AraC family transcriptional regulator